MESWPIYPWFTYNPINNLETDTELRFAGKRNRVTPDNIFGVGSPDGDFYPQQGPQSRAALSLEDLDVDQTGLLLDYWA